MNKKIKQKHFKNSNRDIKLFPTRLIRNLTLRDETGEAIDSQLELLANDFNDLQKSITDQLEILSETVATSCSTLLKPPKRKHSFWFQDSTYLDEMLAKRKKYYWEYLQTRSQLHRQNHKKVQKEIREFLRNMENDWWEKQSTEMEQLSARGNSHAYYKAIKTVYGPQQSKKTCQTFLKKDGSYTNSTEESLERLKEYYYDLLNQNITTSYTTTQYLEELRRPICMKLDEIPTAEEFIKVIKEAKNHKTGTGHISIKILKYATSKHLKPMILQLFLRMWETL